MIAFIPPPRGKGCPQRIIPRKRESVSVPAAGSARAMSRCEQSLNDPSRHRNDMRGAEGRLLVRHDGGILHSLGGGMSTHESAAGADTSLMPAGTIPRQYREAPVLRGGIESPGGSRACLLGRATMRLRPVFLTGRRRAREADPSAQGAGAARGGSQALDRSASF